jgi:hypothetical protein
MLNASRIALMPILLMFAGCAEMNRVGVRETQLGTISPISSSIQISRASYKAKFISTRTYSSSKQSNLIRQSSFGRQNTTVTDTGSLLKMSWDQCTQNGAKKNCAAYRWRMKFSNTGKLLNVRFIDADGKHLILPSRKEKIPDNMRLILQLLLAPEGQFQLGDLVIQENIHSENNSIRIQCIAKGIIIVKERNSLVCALKVKFSGSSPSRFSGSPIRNWSGLMAVDIQTGAIIYSKVNVELGPKTNGGEKLSITELTKVTILPQGKPQKHSTDPVENRLSQLKRLLDQGLITAGEARKKRKKILESF